MIKCLNKTKKVVKIFLTTVFSFRGSDWIMVTKKRSILPVGEAAARTARAEIIIRAFIATIYRQ